MKKTLLVAALAFGFTNVVHAEASVTLYGVVDAGMAYQQTKLTQGDKWVKSRDIGLINGGKSGNRWGLMGAEDLGNGTSAIFRLESGFSLGDGRSAQGNRLFGRESYVGLTSTNWGTLTLGRLNNLAADMLGPYKPFSGNYLQAGVFLGAFGASTYSRMDNAIKYATPDFAGFKAGISYTGKNSKTTSSDGLENSETRDTSNWISAGVSYNNGPISIAGVYDRFETDYRNSDFKQKGTTHTWNLFGSYDFSVVKVYLGYGQVRGSAANDDIVENGGIGMNAAFNDFTIVTNPNSSAYGLNYSETNGYSQQAWMSGLIVPVGGSGKIIFTYQGSATKNTGDAFDGAKGKLNIFSLGYEHALSKRTTAYAAASYGSGKMKFDNAENVRLKSTMAVVGLSHIF